MAMVPMLGDLYLGLPGESICEQQITSLARDYLAQNINQALFMVEILKMFDKIGLRK